MVFLLLATGIAAWGFPHLLPVALAWLRPDVEFLVPHRSRVLYLTIDDAPSTATGEILAVLAKYHVKATFFVMANRVQSIDQLKAITDAGHPLGNHLSGTQACSKRSLTGFQKDFDVCAHLIEPLTPARLFRPPSDLGTTAQVAYARNAGYRTVVGTVFPLDHWLSSPVILSTLAQWLAVDGGILILHDGTERGHTTSATLDRLLPRLQAAGFTFESLP